MGRFEGIFAAFYIIYRGGAWGKAFALTIIFALGKIKR